jgi:membrane-associated phospholipid phosphatase
MTRLLGALSLVAALAVPAAAEDSPFRWPSHTTSAARVSDGLVAAAVTLDTVHAWRSADRKRAFLNEGCRLGLTVGVSELVKRTTHRTRPDGSDDMSFWSEHTAVAMQASGWRYSVGVPIAIGAGYFRMAAGKHYATDVAAGAGMGLLAQWVCR